MDPPDPRPSSEVLEGLEQSPHDKRQCRFVKLENGFEALLIHDPEANMDGVALNIAVGSFSDDANSQGMAMAVLAHLPRDLQAYSSLHAGDFNIRANETSSIIHFEVGSDALPGAVELLRLMLGTRPSPSKAVMGSLASLASSHWSEEERRLQQLYRSFCNQPYCSLPVQALVSREADLGDGLGEFYDKHYSANRMKLCMSSRHSLNSLQQLLEESFSDIESKDPPQNRWDDRHFYTDDKLGTIYFAKSVKDVLELRFTFLLIDEERLFKSQPSKYICHLFGHKGPGSLASYIKSKGWADSLSASVEPVCPGTPEVLHISIQLTEEGLSCYFKICETLFQYVSLLQEERPRKQIFEELKEMADIGFEFQEQVSAMQSAIDISRVMQDAIPREQLLVGRRKLGEFDAPKIEEALAAIRPDNMLLGIVSPNPPEHKGQKREWYGVAYTSEKLPDHQMAKLEAARTISSDQRITELYLPGNNHFIPEGLEVKKKDVSSPALSPQLLCNDDGVKVWFKEDDTFGLPLVNVKVSLKSPVTYASAGNAVKARIFMELVRDTLEGYAHDADVCGLHCSVSLGLHGFLLNIFGYKTHWMTLLEGAFTRMRDLDIQSDRLDFIKERLSREYRSHKTDSAFPQVDDYMEWLNEHVSFRVEDLASELPKIKFQTMKTFQRAILSEMHMETLAHGQLDDQHALKIASLYESIFEPHVWPSHAIHPVRSLVFPSGSNHVYTGTLSEPSTIDNCVETLISIGGHCDRTLFVQASLLVEIVRERFSNQLDRQEQLGHRISVQLKDFSCAFGLAFRVQSKQTTDFIDQRIDAFLEEISKIIEDLADSDFQSYKESLRKKYLERWINPKKEASELWTHIESGYYDFGQAHRDAATIEPLTTLELLRFCQKYVDPSSGERIRMSVHMCSRETGPMEPPQGIAGPVFAETKQADRGQAACSDKPEGVPGRLTAAGSATEIANLPFFKFGQMLSKGASPVTDLREFE